MIRSFIHAVQFLTRLPVPRLASFQPEDLSRAAIWFPMVGIIIGAAVAAALWSGSHISNWLGALAAVVVWTWITGGLHMDGLGDVADGLAAAHRSPERFLEVLRDPHVGAFGAMAMSLQLLTKLVLLAELPAYATAFALILVPAWARWGTLVWSLTIPPLARGSGERFAWQIGRTSTIVHGLALALLSLLLSPVLMVALLIIPAFSLYWRYRLGGMTGDCLGASVELTESLMLLALVIGAAVRL